MDMKSVNLDLSSGDLGTIDEIAENLGVDREAVLRNVIADYLAGYQEEKAESDEAMRDIEAGNFYTNEQVARLLAERTQIKAA